MKGFGQICLVVIFTILGLANGLQGGFEYKYKYFGSIATGIPELSSQASGVAIKSDVIFQVQKDGSAIVQFTKVEVAEFNDKLGCDLRGDIPGKFSAIQNEALNLLIETPFQANLFNHHVSPLIVDINELEWVTNLRKAAVSVFHNQILQGNFESGVDDKIARYVSERQIIPEFQVMEETIFGVCEVDYTIHKLPEYLAAPKSKKYEQAMEKDCQRKGAPEALTEKVSKQKVSKVPTKKVTTKTKTSSPDKYVVKFIDDLWHVVRSVNLDNCEEMVTMQMTPMGVSRSLSGNQYEWIRGRSSVAEYILRGAGGSFRVERIAVEGVTTMAPFGLKSGFIEARSNQTFQLLHVCETKEPLKLPAKSKEIKTWLHAISSPEEPPKINENHKWITYTGKGSNLKHINIFGADPFTKEEFKQIKEFVSRSISSAAKSLADLDQQYEGKTGETIELLNAASYHMKYLSKEDLLDIFNTFQKKQVHPDEVIAGLLTLDLALASGSAEGVRAILQVIKEEKVPYFKIFSLAMTITSSLDNPLAIPELMDYVMSIKIREKPFLAATVYVNFASLLHQMCIQPNAQEVHYPGPLYGDHTCQLDLIKNRFAPFLKEIIYNENSHFWERQIAIAAIYQLGSPYLIPNIRAIIFGQVDFKITSEERLYAISTLDGEKLAKHTSSHVRSEIMAMLTEIFSNVGEDPGVRQIALGTYITWDPEAHFWHKLARTSWREPSRQMASYITTLIESVAKPKHPNFIKHSQAATHALRLAKPLAPSCKYSQIHLDAKRMVDKHVSIFQWFEWIKDERNPERIDTYLLFLLNIGGFEFTNLEFYFNSDVFSASVLKAFDEVQTKADDSSEESEDIATKVAKQYFDKIQESVKPHPLPERDSQGTTLFLRVFEHMQLYLPINKETISKLAFADKTALAQLVVQFTLGYDLNLVKFLNPISLQSFHVSDIGLPVFGRVSAPMVVSEVALLKLGLGGKEFDINKLGKKLSLKSEFFIKFASQGSSSLLVFVPWSKSFVSADVKSNREIIIPINEGFQNDEYGPDDNGHQYNMKYTIEVNYHKKYHVLRADNTPSTAILPIVFLPNSRNPIIKEIVRLPILEKHIDLPQAYTGLHFKISWKSELAFPISSWAIGEYLSNDDGFEGYPFLTYALATPTVIGWNLDVVYEPETSETKKVVIDITHGICGKKPDEEQTTSQEEGQFSQGSADYDVDIFSQDTQQSSQKVFQVFDGELAGSAEFQTTTKEFQIKTKGGIDFNDTPTQRAQKLQTHYNGPVVCDRVQFHFEGTKRRSYEVSYSWNKASITATRKVTKYQIALFRTPIPGRDTESLKICLDVQKSMPKFSPLDNYDTLAGYNFNTDVSAEVTLGCTGSPVFSVKGNYKLTDGAKKVLFEEVKQACDYDPYDPLLSFHRHAVYDDVNYSIGWDKICDMKKLPVLSTAFEYMKMFSPGNILNTKACDNREPTRKIQLSAKRCPLSLHWYLKAKQDNNEVSVDRPDVDEFFNEFYTIRRSTHASYKYPSHLTTHGMEATICSVGVDSVRTFDGNVYKYELSPCYSVAARDCSHKHGAMLLVKAPQGESKMPDVRFIGDHHNMIIDIEGGKVRINGKVYTTVSDDLEEVKDNKGNVLVRVAQKKGHTLFKFEKKYAFAYKDRLEISVPGSLQGKTCGMCGDANLEPDAEFIGPNRCYFEDANTFVASWTAGSETCSAYDLIERREKADKYQKSCKKIDNILYKSATNYSHFCTQYGWKILTLDTDFACVSANPYPFCRDECIPLQESKKHVTFKCWPKSKAPATLLDALAKGEEFFKEILPIDTRGYVSRVEVLTLPSRCRIFEIPVPYAPPRNL